MPQSAKVRLICICNGSIIDGAGNFVMWWLILYSTYLMCSRMCQIKLECVNMEALALLRQQLVTGKVLPNSAFVSKWISVLLCYIIWNVANVNDYDQAPEITTSRVIIWVLMLRKQTVTKWILSTWLNFYPQKEGRCLNWPLCLDGRFARFFSPVWGLCAILLYLLFIYKPLWNKNVQFHSTQKDTSHKWKSWQINSQAKSTETVMWKVDLL